MTERHGGGGPPPDPRHDEGGPCQARPVKDDLLNRGGEGIAGDITRSPGSGPGRDPADVLVELGPVALGVALVQIAEKCPNDQIVVAARLAVEMIDLRRQHRRDVIESAAAISAALPRGWADRWVPQDVIARRRYPPDGDVARWVRDGAA